MIRNCGQHLEAELEILNPAVVILVGGLAIKEILSVPRMTDVIGEAIEHDGVTYVPLPHPSGASTWLNAPENKKSLERALKILGSRTKKAERENNS
jgi:uracil-DNA glycosylase